jgi:hypothetical protein
MKTDCKRNVMMKVLEQFSYLSMIFFLKKKKRERKERKKNKRTSGVYSRQYLHNSTILWSLDHTVNWICLSLMMKSCFNSLPLNSMLNFHASVHAFSQAASLVRGLHEHQVTLSTDLQSNSLSCK